MLVLILTGMWYKDNGINNFVEVFARMIATINSIAVACFFKTTCCNIFKHLLAAGFKDEGFLSLVSTYFGTVETNSQGMLHLHCLIWLCSIFYISQLCNQFQADFEYATCIIVFINHIIRCSIKPKDEVKVLQSDALSAFLDKLDSSFTLKLDIDSNTVAMRFQMYLSPYNATCYKYRAAAIGQCRFDFLCLMNKQTKIIAQSNICNIIVTEPINHVALVHYQYHFCFTNSIDWDIFINFPIGFTSQSFLINIVISLHLI